MKILIELSLFINIIINFFILKCTAQSVASKAKFAFISSALGAAVALILPMFALNGVSKILIQIFLSLAMCFICFDVKPIKNFVVAYSVFLGFTFLFGGACLAIENAFGQLPLLGVLAIVTAVYLFAKAILRHQNKIKRIKKFTFKVRIQSDKYQVEDEGFLDSGNLLYDPVTKQPIILINFDIFSKLQPSINYLSAYCKKIDMKKLKNGHYVKINTVASGTSILVFTVDKVQIFEGQQKKDYSNMAVGLTFSGFEKSIGKNILLHRELA